MYTLVAAGRVFSFAPYFMVFSLLVPSLSFTFSHRRARHCLLLLETNAVCDEKVFIRFVFQAFFRRFFGPVRLQFIALFLLSTMSVVAGLVLAAPLLFNRGTAISIVGCRLTACSTRS
jgi:hypothetical protein